MADKGSVDGPLFPKEIALAIEGLQGEQRQRILIALLQNDELSFSELMKITNMGNSLLANYVKELKRLLMIEQYYEHSRDDKSYSYYRISDFAKNIINALNNVMNPLQNIMFRYTRVCDIIEGFDSNSAISLPFLKDICSTHKGVVASSTPVLQIPIKRGQKNE